MNGFIINPSVGEVKGAGKSFIILLQHMFLTHGDRTFIAYQTVSVLRQQNAGQREILLTAAGKYDIMKTGIR